MGVIRLADKHTKAKLEAVCRKALTYSGVPSYKGIKNLFATLKAEDLDECLEKPKKRNPYGFTRGAEYYGGKQYATE